MKKIAQGFTLIETLIAIFTIGILAVYTVPSLNSNYGENFIISKLQKHNTDLERFYQKAISLKGAPQYWHKNDITGTEVLNIIFDGIETNKNCKGNYNCPSRQNYSSLDGTTIGRLFSSTINNACAILMDGSFICINPLKTNCRSYVGSTPSVCGQIVFDFNGVNYPNTMGKDVFVFYYTNDRIVPGEGDYTKYCNKYYKSKSNGYACASWVLRQNNMDYLKRKIY